MIKSEQERAKKIYSSHLSVESQQGRCYEYKRECAWCYAPYDLTKSEAKNFEKYCHKECELADIYVEDE